MIRKYGPVAAIAFCQVVVSCLTLLNLQQIKSEISASEHVITLSASRTVRAELVRELWTDDDPFKYANAKHVDDGYPHTNIRESHIEAILQVQEGALFWLEVGSMLGGSAIRTARVVKQKQLNSLSIICIDPFTGDVNMWAWERSLKEQNRFRFLKLERGAPSIYTRFLANVYANHAHEMIMPIVATSIVGIKLLERLLSEGRLHSRPDVLFLDSAHEVDETFMELQHAWRLLRVGGVLFGDDWSWAAVASDVRRFAGGVNIDTEKLNKVQDLIHGHFDGGVLVVDGIWYLAKK